ncbi:MAG: pyruvate kinase [Candidatus Omnitrophota bacterium]|nr:pyruvate kinase [Candidatus Omnitrophota bacterium]
MTKTKIICTLGPASFNETMIRKMMLAGMDVARLNFSHGKPDDLIRAIGLIRRLNAKYRRRVRILGDLQGHRIRIGSIQGGSVTLKRNKTLWLTQEKIKGNEQRIYFDYKGPLADIKKGRQIYIDDGNIALEVARRARSSLKTKVVVGGLLKEHKGVNIPQADLKFGPLSEKDRHDIHFCVHHKVDYVAQSFVRTRADILEVKRHLHHGSSIRIIAKIESGEGIKNIDSIIGVSDGIMIARGDMGVSVPIYQIPIIQKMIIKKCNRADKPVITATQMLESMTEHRRPTRAEVTDVANAIIDGTDFVMLSAESAVGRYPAETVAMMNDIIKFTEKYAK